MSQNNIVPSALAELITTIMKIGRKCPEAGGDILELMLLVSRIQACIGIDPGYDHAKRVIARLRNPLWDDLTPDEREVLRQAAEAIKRACKLKDADIPEDGEPEPGDRPPPSCEIIKGGIEAEMRSELSEAQLARIATTVQTLMQHTR